RSSVGKRSSAYCLTATGDHGRHSKRLLLRMALVGRLFVEGSLLSLLPFADADFDGALVWGRSWAVRPTWLPYVLVVLLCMGCAGLTAVQFPAGYIRAYLAELAQPAPLVLVGLWGGTGVVVMSRFKLVAAKASARGSDVAIGASP